jgi:hypothetical protein
MPSYENMMTTVTILLFFINAMFIFANDLPGVSPSSWSDSNTYERLQIGVSPKDVNDMNNRINDLINQSGVFKPENIDLNAITTVSGQQKNYLTLFQTWLFGALDVATLGLSTKLFSGFALLGTIIGLFGATFFGYFFWINFLIPPAAGAGFFAIGAAIKAFLFIIQLMGIFDIIFNMFYAGTGTRG